MSESKVSKVINYLKTRAEKFVTMLKEFLQKIDSFITEKLARFFKKGTIMVSQNFYNQVMNLVNKIDRIAPDPIQKFKLDVTLLTADQEYVKNIYSELESRYNELQQEAKNLEILRPTKGDSIITVRVAKLEKIKKDFTEMRKSSTQCLNIMQIVVTTLSKNMDIPESEVAPAVSSLCKAASLSILKGRTIVSLINKLMRSGYSSEEEMNANTPASESMSCLWDDMMITEESLRGKDIRSISKTSSKDVKNYEKEIFNMPESNEEEIKAKLSKVEEIRDNIGDYIDRLKDMQPDKFDKLISVLSRITSTALSVGTFYYGARNSIDRFSGVNSKASYTKIAMIIAGTKLLNDETFKKAFISNKTKAKNMLIKELSSKDSKFAILEKGLKMKLS